MRVEGEKLLFTAPVALSPELRSQLKAHKEEILALMRPDVEPRVKICPPSLVQRRFLTLQKLNPEESFYNDPFCFRLIGALNIDILRKSFDAIFRRHESLRTTLQEVDGQLMQVIAPNGQINLATQDLSACPTEGKAEAIKRALIQEMGRPFDLASEPGFRALLVIAGNEEFFLEFCFHNTFFDLNSLFVLLNELSLHYAALLSGGLPDLLAPAQYAEYVRWFDSVMPAEMEGRLAYWRDWFQNGPPPAWTWKSAKPAPAAISFHNLLTWHRCSPALTAELKAFSQRRGTTLYFTLLTAFGLVMKRHTGCSDITLGTTYSNRDNRRFEFVMGATIQVLAIRIDLSEDSDFGMLIPRMQTAVASALTWQDVPFDKLAPLMGFSRPPGPLFRVVVTYLPDVLDGRLNLPGIEVEFLEKLVHDSSRPDLYIVLFEKKTPEGNALAWYWLHKHDVFDQSAADAMNRDFRELLEAMALA